MMEMKRKPTALEIDVASLFQAYSDCENSPPCPSPCNCIEQAREAIDLVKMSAECD